MASTDPIALVLVNVVDAKAPVKGLPENIKSDPLRNDSFNVG